MISQSDRRDFIRMDVETEIRVTRAATKQVVTGKCLNLSSTGLAAILNEALDMGEEVEVFIDSIGNQIRPLEAVAKVQRVQPLDDGQYDIGLAITGYA